MENKSKLSKESFKPLFGSWWPKIEKFFDSGEMDKIYEYIKSESKRGKKILPDSKNVFRAFEECPMEELKCVIVGLSPYHSLKNNEPIADGLCLSCGITKYPQPSLDQFFNAMEFELNKGLCLPCIKNPDLTYLANQGVLLLNMGLSVELNKPNSHGKLWSPFMEYLFTKVLDIQGIPIVLLGKEAARLERYINPFNTIFKLVHPAAASYNSEVWNSEGTFQAINKILKSKFNETINWFDEPQEAPF